MKGHSRKLSQSRLVGTALSQTSFNRLKLITLRAEIHYVLFSAKSTVKVVEESSSEPSTPASPMSEDPASASVEASSEVPESRLPKHQTKDMPVPSDHDDPSQLQGHVLHEGTEGRYLIPAAYPIFCFRIVGLIQGSFCFMTSGTSLASTACELTRGHLPHEYESTKLSEVA